MGVTLITFCMHVEIYKQTSSFQLRFSSAAQACPVSRSLRYKSLSCCSTGFSSTLQVSILLLSPLRGSIQQASYDLVYAVGPQSLSQLHPRRDLQGTPPDIAAWLCRWALTQKLLLASQCVEYLPESLEICFPTDVTSNWKQKTYNKVSHFPTEPRGQLHFQRQGRD